MKPHATLPSIEGESPLGAVITISVTQGSLCEKLFSADRLPPDPPRRVDVLGVVPDAI